MNDGMLICIHLSKKPLTHKPYMYTLSRDTPNQNENGPCGVHSSQAPALL